MTTLGEKFRQLRKARGFSQRKLADLAGVSNDYISKIEKGKNENVGVITLKKIADALMVSPFELQSDTPLSQKALKPHKARSNDFQFKPDKSTTELLKLWSHLDRADRKVILNVAKQLANL